MKKPSATKIKKLKQGEAEIKIWTYKTDFKWPEPEIVSINLEKSSLEKYNNSLCEVAKWFRAFEIGYKCAGGGSNISIGRMAKNIENLADFHEITQANLSKADLKKKENKITIKKQ